jgi:hypothetical protein
MLPNSFLKAPGASGIICSVGTFKDIHVWHNN